MIAALLLSLVTAPQDTPQDAGQIARAGTRLSACKAGACAGPPPESRFRIDNDEAGAATAKDRAFSADGSQCNVVGARRCTSNGRTVFSTDFTD